MTDSLARLLVSVDLYNGLSVFTYVSTVIASFKMSQAMLFKIG